MTSLLEAIDAATKRRQDPKTDPIWCLAYDCAYEARGYPGVTPTSIDWLYRRIGAAVRAAEERGRQEARS